VGWFHCRAGERLKNEVLRRPIAPAILARRRGTPGRRQVIWREGVLRRPREWQWSGLGGRAIRSSGTVRSKMLVEIFVDHLGSGLRALPDRNRGLGPKRARVALPVAE